MRTIYNHYFSKIKKILFLFFLFYSINGNSQNAPGGVFTNLQLWVRADTGVVGFSNISEWNDMSGNSNHASQSNSSNQPSFLSNNINYNPAIDFQGNPNQNPFSNFDFLNIGTTSINITNSLTLFYVNTLDIIGEHFIIGHQDGWTRWRFGNTTFQSNKGFINFGQQTNPNIPNIFCINVNNTTGTFFRNNTSVLSNTSMSSGNFASNNLWIGGAETNGVYSFDGKISEIVAFNSSLSISDQLKVASYLAIKYALTLGSSSNILNYLDSDGTIIWAGDTIYQNNIIGIARDDLSKLLQKQSKQLDDTTRIYIGTLNSTNVLNSGNFNSDKQFVLIGHNNHPLRSTGGKEFPPFVGIYSRINREWKVCNTNFNGSFSLDIKLNTSPINVSDLRLLIDDDGNFSNAIITTPTFTLNSGVLTISNISNALIPVNSTKYITIASMNSTTLLPVELLSFEVKGDKQNAILKWATASEKNNKGFFIEISKDAYTFEPIGFIEGKNNSATTTKYQFKTDPLPAGNHYFRLKQIDYDENFEYSQIVSLKIDSSLIPFSIINNTASNNVRIYSNNNQCYNYKLFDNIGKNLFDKDIESQDETICLNNYLNGIYFLIIESNGIYYSYKIIKTIYD